MDLKIQPLKPEELDDFIRLYWSAFEPLEANMIFPMIYPRGLQPDLMERHRSRILRTTKSDLGSYCFVAKDVDTGDIAAVSWWAFSKNPPQTKGEIDSTFEVAYQNRNAGPPVESWNAELDNAFFKAAFYSEMQVTAGRPYMSLRLLAVDPKHQRRGAGTLLLEHFLAEVDRLQLPAYLDSGVSGKALYERFGFEVIMDFPLNCLDYGGRSDGRHWCMLRPARTS